MPQAVPVLMPLIFQLSHYGQAWGTRLSCVFTAGLEWHLKHGAVAHVSTTEPRNTARRCAGNGEESNCERLVQTKSESSGVSNEGANCGWRRISRDWDCVKAAERTSTHEVKHACVPLHPERPLLHHAHATDGGVGEQCSQVEAPSCGGGGQALILKAREHCDKVGRGGIDTLTHATLQDTRTYSAQKSLRAA